MSPVERPTCDRCSARALHKVTMHTVPLGDLVLLFCGHHFDEHAPKIDELVSAGTVSVSAVDMAVSA